MLYNKTIVDYRGSGYVNIGILWSISHHIHCLNSQYYIAENIFFLFLLKPLIVGTH